MLFRYLRLECSFQQTLIGNPGQLSGCPRPRLFGNSMTEPAATGQTLTAKAIAIEAYA